MSDTKTVSNLLESSQRARFELEETVKGLRQDLHKARVENNHLRAEDRRLAGQLGTVGEGLQALLVAAVQASEDNPGHASLAARVREARAAVKVYNAATGAGHADPS